MNTVRATFRINVGMFLSMLLVLFGATVPVTAPVMAAGDAGDGYGLGQVLDTNQKPLYIGGNQIGNRQALPEIVGNIISTLLTFIGIVFFILMLAAGVIWMTSRGNEDRTSQAIQIIYTSIVGIIIVMGSYALTKFIFRVSEGPKVDTTNLCSSSGTSCQGRQVGESCEIIGFTCQRISTRCECLPPVMAPESNSLGRCENMVDCYAIATRALCIGSTLPNFATNPCEYFEPVGTTPGSCNRKPSATDCPNVDNYDACIADSACNWEGAIPGIPQ